MFALKIIRGVVFLKCLLTIVLFYNYRNVIYGLAQKYKGKVSQFDFKILGKLTTKKRKVYLDVNFLKYCHSFDVFPEFIFFPLPFVNNQDI